MNKLIVFAMLSVGMVSCYTATPSLGDREVVLFAHEPVNFNPAENCTNLEDSVIQIDNGRIVLRKVTLPKYQKAVKVTIEAEVVSAGDPWDKTGSLFLIPSASEVNFLTQNDQFARLVFPDTTQNHVFPGVLPQNGYAPPVEILRFMTPFGVGHFSNDSRLNLRKPVYVPQWASTVEWKLDVTQLLSELEGEVWIGAFIDVWTAEGYRFSAKLKYDESDAVVHPVMHTKVIPLVNTTRYIEPQRLYDEFSRSAIEYAFDVPAGYKSAKLYYITTGHGGHKGGDEFVKKQNIVSLNGVELYNDVPWRDDCASFRRFNPHSGVWTEKRIARTGNLKTGDTKETEIDEFIASSDYSRSNWCPGSLVEPVVMDIADLKAGSNTLSIRIPEAQRETQNELNHWNVSAYIVLSK